MDEIKPCVCKKQQFYYIAESDEPREVMRCNWCDDVLTVAEPDVKESSPRE